MFIPTTIVVLFNKVQRLWPFFFLGCQQLGCGGGRVVEERERERERETYTLFLGLEIITLFLGLEIIMECIK